MASEWLTFLSLHSDRILELKDRYQPEHVHDIGSLRIMRVGDRAYEDGTWLLSTDGDFCTRPELQRLCECQDFALLAGSHSALGPRPSARPPPPPFGTAPTLFYSTLYGASPVPYLYLAYLTYYIYFTSGMPSATPSSYYTLDISTLVW